MEFEFHGLANIFPLLEGEQFAELVEDVRKHGVLEPVVLYNWKILDGRNRYRAAKEAQVECPFACYGSEDIVSVPVEDYQPTHGEEPIPLAFYDECDFKYLGDLDDLTGFVVSKNLKRRHLDESQRAMVGAKLATMQHGGDRTKPSIEGLSTEQASEMLNVGRASVERAKTVQRDGAPDLVHAVEQGDVSVSAAAEFAKQPKEDQDKQIADAGSPADAVRAFRGSLPSKAEANKKALELEAATGYTHAVLGKDGKYHSGATDAEIEVGDLYLTMAAALRSVISLDIDSAEKLIATVTPQSRGFFPKMLDDAERVVAKLKAEWSKVHAGQQAA